jgi:hypothetical protein
MEWLEPPFQFFHPQPEVPFDLPVVRYEVGQAQRPIADPPGSVIKPTIRFHLAKPIPPGLFMAVRTGFSPETDRISPDELEARPYLDFTNQYLINRVLVIYHELIQRSQRTIPFHDVALMDKLLDSQSEALTLRLTRHGLRIDTTYDVEAVYG